MTRASALRTRAAAHQARADRLERICAMFSGRAAHLRKTDVAGAIALQVKADRAARAEEKALFLALGCRVAASVIEHAETRSKALFEVAA